VKEFIGASDETVIASTGGALRFEFDAAYDEEIKEYVVDADRFTYPEDVRDRGTVVYGTDDSWEDEDLAAVEDFVDRLWMPEDQDLDIAVYNDRGEVDSRDTVRHVEPDAVLERQYLPTLVVEEGVQETVKRRADIEVRKTMPGRGGIYEMGIPVTTDEDFPFLFNVGQKTPVTERRNELDNSYRTDLMQSVIDERLDLFDDDELAEEYVTQYISQYTHKTSSGTQREYIERWFGEDPDDLLVYTGETPSMAVTWAMQRQLPMENADEYSRHVQGMLRKQCPSVQEWYSEQQEDRAIEVIAEPGPDQEAFLEYVESALIPRTHTSGVDFELAYISEDTTDGQTKATYSPSEETSTSTPSPTTGTTPHPNASAPSSTNSATTTPTPATTATAPIGTTQ